MQQPIKSKLLVFFIQIFIETQQTVQSQKVQIEQLQRQIEQLTTKSDDDPPENEGKAVLYRSCEELRSVDPDSGSGGYWIDPDGVVSGDPPIYVQCNMTTGSSRLVHCNILQ